MESKLCKSMSISKSGFIENDKSDVEELESKESFYTPLYNDSDLNNLSINHQEKDAGTLLILLLIII